MRREEPNGSDIPLSLNIPPHVADVCLVVAQEKLLLWMCFGVFPWVMLILVMSALLHAAGG